MKTCLLPILLLTFFINILSAQKNSSFDLILGMDYSSRTNTKIEDLELTDDIGNTIPSSSKIIGNPSLRFGMSFNHQLGEEIWIKSGLRYTHFGYTFIRNINEVLNFSDFESKEKLDLSFLEIPFLLRYEFGNKKWSPFVEIGVASNYYLRSKSTLSFTATNPTRSDESVTSSKVETVNQWQFSGIISFGYQYQLNEQFRLLIQPNFRYFLTENFDQEKIMFDSFFVDYRNYSFGLEMGCRMMI